MEQVWAVQGQGAVTVEWRPSAAAGPRSSGNLDSDGPQTAVAACAAEPGSGAESACMLERERHQHLFLKCMY